jgi:hypothetical protein
VKPASVGSLENVLSGSVNNTYSQAKQFQSGTVFDNQSYSINVGSQAKDFAVGDLNHDGLSDVAVIKKQPSEICIYNRSSNGALSNIPWKLSKADIVDMRSIAIGDMNNDGMNDIVVSYNDTGGVGHIAIFYQSASSPLYSPSTCIQLNVDAQPYDIVIGKFGSSVNCIAAICMGSPFDQDDYINIWRYPFSNPSADFYRISISIFGIPVFTKSQFLATGFVNGDDRMDLVVGNLSGSNVFVAIQPTTWKTAWTTYLKTASGAASDIQLADVTGDGRSDLIFADSTSSGGYSRVRIYENEGTGFSINSQVPIRTPLGLGTIAAGNLSGDSSVDLVALSYTFANASAYLHDGLGFYSQYSNLTFPVDVSPLKSIVDDSIVGHRGLFILCQGPAGGNGSLTWYCANPKLSGNADDSIFTASDKPTTLALDTLSDGRTILATTLTASNRILLHDEGSGLSWTLITQSAPVAAVFGKFSSSGEYDLAVLNSVSHTISLYHESKLFTSAQPYDNVTIPSNPNSLFAKSLRGNGLDDLLVGYGNGCCILFNTGGGHPFNQSSNETVGSTIAGNRTAIAVSDFNLDGNPNDIALVNSATNMVEIYLRNAAGGPGSYYFHDPKAYLSAENDGIIQTIIMGDFGGPTKDGAVEDDIAAITQNGKLLVFFQPSYGFNDAMLNPELSIPLKGKPSSVAVGDVNDDGYSDILIGYSDSPRMAAYLRTDSGTFANMFNFTTGAAPANVMAQDMNGDNRTDIICASPGSHSISVWFQNNLAPLVYISGPSQQDRGQDASFNGTFCLDSNSDIDTLNYTWSFGDGYSGYGMEVTHRYLNNITYYVSLTVTDRGGLRNSVCVPIKIVQTYPSASCTIWPGMLSEGLWVSFNDTSRSSTISHSAISSWEWEFDGVITNTSKNAKQHFAAGVHTVRLSVTDTDGISNSTPLHSFTVSEVAPSASFQSAINRVGSPSYFNSTSRFAWTPIVGYRWDFGDGSSKDGMDTTVTHSYTMKGWYKVILNVTDAQGFTDEEEQWLFVKATPPTATLQLNGASIEGEVTKFSVTTTSFNPIVTWNWSYDSSQTWHLYGGDLAGASYTFTECGTQWVGLNVTEEDGSWTLTGMMLVVQDVNPEIIGFDASNGRTYQMDQSVGFWASAVSYKPITKYEWNFDSESGGTWVASTPLLTNHTTWVFTEPKIYYVKLRVWDDDGFTEYASHLEVQVKNLPPVAHFSSQNSTERSGVVLFDATLSTDTPSDVASLAYGWNFEDQGGWTKFSTDNRVISHEFARDGRYNITLMVKDQWGSISALAQTVILVDRTAPSVVMESTGDNASAGQGIVVKVKVSDPYGIRNVTLIYRINNGNESFITMTPMNEPDTYYGQIPAQVSNTNVSYCIIAVDDNNNPYLTQTYQLNIKAATSLGISADYLALLTAIMVIITALILLVFRSLVPVDEVFIIFQDGQLMAHQTRRIKPGMDDDILASMFIAIQMFVKDSFKDESSTGLNRLDFGEKKILVEKGESFYLAVVLHSNRTGSVPNRMRTVMEDIQKDFGPSLKGWNGDLEKVRGIKDTVDPLVKRKGLFGNR